MMTRRISLASIGTVAAFSLLTLIGSHNSVRGAGPVAALHDSELHQQIARIRAATAKYHDIDVAIEEGFVQLAGDLGNCLETPGLGAAGIHYSNAQRFVSPQLILEEPELLVYIPTGGGNLRLVAVEYANRALFRDTRPPDTPGFMPGVFPWRQETIPPFLQEVSGPFSLLGQQSEGPIFAGRWLYFLHAWVWAHNPNGMFADLHPQLSCN